MDNPFTWLRDGLFFIGCGLLLERAYGRVFRYIQAPWVCLPNGAITGYTRLPGHHPGCNHTAVFPFCTERPLLQKCRSFAQIHSAFVFYGAIDTGFILSERPYHHQPFFTLCPPNRYLSCFL